MNDGKNNQVEIDSNIPIPTSSNAVVKPAEKKLDLDAPGVAKLVAKRIAEDIDRYCETEYDDGPRKHLGASLIGDECKRKLWYVFRWCHHHKFTGRMQRLFNRGHREEDRFIEWLEGIGCKVWTHDFQAKPLYFIQETAQYYFEEELETDVMKNLAIRVTEETDFRHALKMGKKFPQYRISGVGGHFGGSLDGIALLPEHYGIEGPVLCEFKTNGTGAAFNALTVDGMPLAKPQHFAQTSTYGNEYRFKWCLYLNINKNDDSLHVELVKLDWNLGEQNKAKAETIILSQEPPPRLSNNPTFKSCQYCDMKGICHEGKMVDRNCRSCQFASPQPGGVWFCQVHNGNIPENFIPQACEHYKSIAVNV